MDVKIESVHFVARWTWDCSVARPNDDTCGICRNLFDAPCPGNCKVPGDDCPVVTGKCIHSFHLHCIEKWAQRESANPLCPMCRRSWELA